MTPLQWPSKDPDEVLDYEVDWSARLGSDTISTSTWAIPAGITRDSSSKTSTTTKIWLSGGSANTQYTLTNRIVTTAGRTHDQQISILIEGLALTPAADPPASQWSDVGNALEDAGIAEDNTAADNTAGIALLEANWPGADIDLGGQNKVYAVTSLPNGAQYYNGAFSVGSDIIYMPRNPLAHPFDGASMMAVNPVMGKYQGCHLFWEQPADRGQWLFAWRDAEKHNADNGAQIFMIDSIDKGRRPFSDNSKRRLAWDANYDTTIHCPVEMSNGRIGFIARQISEAGSYGTVKFIYTDTAAQTRAVDNDHPRGRYLFSEYVFSEVTITLTKNCTPYGDMLPYPASAGGSDAGGYIWYYYQGDYTHAVYTLDYGASWTELTNVAYKGSNGGIQEASIVRIGNLNRWAMFSRQGNNVGVHLSTNMTTWGTATQGDLYSYGSAPTAFYEWGKIWILVSSRQNGALITEYENAILIASIDPEPFWSSGGTDGFSGWQVVTDAAAWPMGYWTVRKFRDRWYAGGQIAEGHTQGGSTSRTSMLGLLGRAQVEQAPITQGFLQIPRPNLVVDGEFKIWPRGTSVTGTTRKRVTPSAAFGRSSAVGNWTVSRQTGDKGAYCMRIARDEGTSDLQAMSLNFTLTTPDSLPIVRNQELIVASFRARKGIGFSGANSRVAIQFKQTATGDQVTTGNTGVFVTGDTTLTTATSTITLTEDWQDFEYTAGPTASTTQQLLLHLTYTPVGTASSDYWEIEQLKIEMGFNKTPFVCKPYAQLQAECDRLLQQFTVRSINGTVWVPFSCIMNRVPEVTLSAGTAGNISTAGFELTHTSAATITVTADGGL